MSIKDILLATYIALSKLFKNKLLKALQSLREKYVELEETITQLKAENAKLKEQLKSAKIKSVNKNANKPSSKQAEWEEKGVGNDRIIEDIPDPIEKPEIIKVVQEKKYCADCQKVITAKSESALPKADIGLNATILICYLWVAICLPFTKIQDYS
ncbi:MAG: hypothetical protein GY850_17845, partial [bacterium]|nr:hypothetical protein [bacterium]